ncbi:MAG: rhomboid family intramembrane serine protease, partial [Rickettsiales bacterium]|nr:rhomboid family intramembrane serine protease [Rickettsiales bacterium]
PMIGASGAISGVLGAYLLLYPRANIRVLLMMFYIGIVNIPAKIVLGGWFLIQFLSGVADNGGGAGVAFWAHIGGFVCGMALVKLFIRKDEHLFHKQVTRPWGTSRLSDKNKPKGPWGLG